jgi:hypothetical protein
VVTLSIWKALGSIPSTEKKSKNKTKQENKRKKEEIIVNNKYANVDISLVCQFHLFGMSMKSDIDG